MILDERRKTVNRFMVGMADIQLAHNALASEIILIYNELSVDHYQDSLIAEVERCKKLAIFRKKDDMNFVPQEDFNYKEELVEDTDNIPYEVLLTATGLPRMPRKDDMVLNDGVLYSVHHVKPINRDYKGLWQLIVYPERTTFIDTLHIYKALLLNPKNLFPINDIMEYLNEEEEVIEQPIGLGMGLGATLGSTDGSVTPIDEPSDGEPADEPSDEPSEEVKTKEVIVDFVWGGKPEFLSLDKTKTWIPFESRIKIEMSTNNIHPILYVKGGMEVIQVRL